MRTDAKGKQPLRGTHPARHRADTGAKARGQRETGGRDAGHLIQRKHAITTDARMEVIGYEYEKNDCDHDGYGHAAHDGTGHGGDCPDG